MPCKQPVDHQARVRPASEHMSSQLKCQKWLPWEDKVTENAEVQQEVTASISHFSSLNVPSEQPVLGTDILSQTPQWLVLKESVPTLTFGSQIHTPGAPSLFSRLTFQVSNREPKTETHLESSKGAVSLVT
ncbi:hypothetical protein NPIL_33561 [Nephila pilipes]|uniref:Uncharacterized protein n=1 Tax=Nephila pilipes TaxID=299642 RepID=A0A8X6UFE6_NEPPI|nr:hypothetical protein NPIL_33561 [Nephila pilipes]